ncbi:MAG TPA: glycosyltransferase family 4 protein [Acidobacteriota bacterium]|nr:glycosyltransferase family 4 protein [Acidobacteriota bacterium]
MIHNEYASLSGEEVQFRNIADVLKSKGHRVEIFTRNSSELYKNPLGHIKGFFSGLYNPYAARAILSSINRDHPDHVYVQNLYPLISPSVLPRIKDQKIPIIMSVANYRLMCPNGLHFSRGEVCERCLGGREWWCMLRDCEENFLKSTAYAVRNWNARVRKLYLDNVSAFICASDFLRQRLIAAGFKSHRIHVIPNIIEIPKANNDKNNSHSEGYVGFVGRLSREKGIDVLLDVARLCPEIQFRLAGRESHDYPLPSPLPKNVQSDGFMEGEELETFYLRARIILSTSRCFETFGMSIAEAMVRGKPVIVPNIGVFPSFVKNGQTGMLAEVGDAKSFSAAIRYLWGETDERRRISTNARLWACRYYSAEAYYASFSQLLNQLSSI